MTDQERAEIRDLEVFAEENEDFGGGKTSPTDPPVRSNSPMAGTSGAFSPGGKQDPPRMPPE
jgi:hypothetical protein